MALPECTEEELQALYEWVDSVPLSRPKKSIARDFADGVLTAELVAHYFPKLVELHNYSPAHNSVQKMYNWSTLNQKVFKRMGFALAREQFEAVANAEAGAIERVLKLVRTRMARFQEGGSTAGGGGGSGRNSIAAVRQAGGGGAAAAAAVSSSSQPGSPAHYAPRQQQQQQQQQGQGQAADHASQAADSIAALRIAAEVPAKLLQQQQGSGGKGAVCLTATAFPTLDQALSASLADKEQQLEELRETNEILETKIGKLEQLVRLKDAKIQALLARLQAAAQADDPAAAATMGTPASVCSS